MFLIGAVYHPPKPLCQPTSMLDDIDAVTRAVVSDRLTATEHVNNLVSSCSSLLYVPRVLRSHGRPVTALHDVFRATVVAKVTYGAPAWSGMCTAADRANLNTFINRC